MATSITTPVHTTVVGVFDDHDRALTAIVNLRRANFSEQQIGYIAPGPRPSAAGPDGTDADQSAGVGAAIGAAAGGAAGLVAAASALTPIGPVVAGGALFAWLASVGTGAATGAIVGALIGLGISEHDAQWYENELKAGHTLVIVHDTDERSDDARSIIRHHGGTIHEPADIGTYGTGLPATPY